jgi:N-acetylmuramic acid 6-phosphate (MurNAc-6-P) etherase
MALATTEAVNANARGLDLQPPATILRLLADAQIAASQSVRNAVPAIEKAAETAAKCRLPAAGCSMPQRAVPA